MNLGEFWTPPTYPAALMIDGKAVRQPIRVGRPLVEQPRPADQVVVTPDDDIEAVLEALR